MSRSCLVLAFAFLGALAIPAAARGQSAMSMAAGSQGKMSDTTHKTSRPARKRATTSAMAAPGAMAKHDDGMKKGAMKHGDAMMKHDDGRKKDGAMKKNGTMKKDGAMMKPDDS